ncbi:MAG: DUF2442 domain-containing protein [Planctomycetota bacterium]
MYIEIKQARPLKNHQVLVVFDNGEERVFDLAPYLGRGVFRQLQDETLFKAVRVGFDTLEWPNGADLCPETVYKESVPATKEMLTPA